MQWPLHNPELDQVLALGDRNPRNHPLVLKLEEERRKLGQLKQLGLAPGEFDVVNKLELATLAAVSIVERELIVNVKAEGSLPSHALPVSNA